MATPIDVVVLKCRKLFSDGKSAKSCVIYRTKNFGSLSNWRYCGVCLKIEIHEIYEIHKMYEIHCLKIKIHEIH